MPQMPPNILLVMADQLTPGALAAYGNRVVAAPHIAALGSSGVVFDSAYCNSPAGATLAFLRKTLKREGRIASLDSALARAKIDDAGSEFETIVRELYAKTVQFRVGIKLLDRSALDWPELAALWSGHWRAGLVNQLYRYLDLRISKRLLSPVPDTKAWGRLIVETVAFFALHRHYDPFPTAMREPVAEDTVVRALIRATNGEVHRKRGK